MQEHPIVFFDGVCNFCNYWVNFAIRRDPAKKMRFSPFQGETAKQILPRYGITHKTINSVIFIEKERAYTQSSAAIRICRHLTGGWKLFYGLMIIPKLIRDPFYNLIARNRYRWFGKKDSCMIPSPDLLERFLP